MKLVSCNFLSNILLGMMLALCPIYVLGQSISIPTSLGESIQLDEFDHLPCDDWMGRIDRSLSDAIERPEMTLFVVSSVNPKQKYEGVITQRSMENYIRMRRFPKDRIKFVRTKSDQSLSFQIWLVPQDTNLSNFGAVDESLLLPDGIKPFLLLEEEEIEDPICPGINKQAMFADFLKANPESRGNIVIRQKSHNEASRLKNNQLKILTTTYKVPKERLRFFLVDPDPKQPYDPIIEYWFLP